MLGIIRLYQGLSKQRSPAMDTNERDSCEILQKRKFQKSENTGP